MEYDEGSEERGTGKYGAENKMMHKLQEIPPEPVPIRKSLIPEGSRTGRCRTGGSCTEEVVPEATAAVEEPDVQGRRTGTYPLRQPEEHIQSANQTGKVTGPH